jgi:hypothetical protein
LVGMGGVFRMECLSGGEGGGRVCLKYSLVNFFVGMSRAILVNYARFIRDIHRDIFEIWEIHARLTMADLLGWLLVQVALRIV